MTIAEEAARKIVEEIVPMLPDEVKDRLRMAIENEIQEHIDYANEIASELL